MISAISKRISDFILGNSRCSDENLSDVYQYGIEIFISSFLNIFLILMIGVLFNSVLESIVFLLCFVPLRLVAGGWHASTYFMCNAVFCICFTFVLLLSNLSLGINSFWLVLTILAVSFFPVAIFCPVENPNKPVRNKRKMKLFSISFYFLFSVICIIFYFFLLKLCYILLFTLLCVSIAICAGAITSKISKNS